MRFFPKTQKYTQNPKIFNIQKIFKIDVFKLAIDMHNFFDLIKEYIRQLMMYFSKYVLIIMNYLKL
jgi:hypothetical protein